MRDLLERRPLLSAAIAVVVLWVILQATLAATTDVQTKTWPGYVLLGVVVYAALAVWLTTRSAKAAGPSPAALRLALSGSPALVTTGLAFEGAAGWAVWATFGSCTAMVIASALVTRRAEASPSE